MTHLTPSTDEDVTSSKSPCLIFYYTFLDTSMDYYTSINTNFIELTKMYTYFVLVSGKKDGKPYSEHLKSILGPQTIYIESDENSMVIKFNLFRQYLKINTQYNDSIFCKIDTDLVHYNTKKMHDFLRDRFQQNKNLFIGNQGFGENVIRGGLNAIHYNSIISCGDLSENYNPSEFDEIFSKTLFSNGIKKHVVPLFYQGENINKFLFATHVVNQKLSDKKN